MSFIEDRLVSGLREHATGGIVEPVPFSELSVTGFKVAGTIHVSDEFLIDAGLMDPPPIDPETRRRWAREARRRAVAYAIAKPLDWLSRGAAWLHVEAINAGLWAVGDRSRVWHEDGHSEGRNYDEDDY